MIGCAATVTRKMLSVSNLAVRQNDSEAKISETNARHHFSIRENCSIAEVKTMASNGIDQENKDAEKVNQALEALMKGNVHTAEAWLRAVIENTPPNYVNEEPLPEGGKAIKFWSEEDFFHYIAWHEEHGGVGEKILWIGNAYPRAHYYMGFVCVKTKRFKEAIEYLERGQALESTNPKFQLEKAQALIGLDNKQAALAIYEAITETTPYVGVSDTAFALRGRGFVLIEMGYLTEAEAAFRASLEIEPHSEVARNELRYIQHLRAGGETAPTQSVETRSEQQPTKKWWEFWK
jgi:tetratricopeptide (TPR) repeat protein